MKLIEIRDRINDCLKYQVGADYIKSEIQPLINLFIELSNERCVDQLMIADDNYHRVCEDLFIKHDTTISDTILNAPLPLID